MMGLHPPHPVITTKLATHHLQATGEWFHVMPRTAFTDRVLADAPVSSIEPGEPAEPGQAAQENVEVADDALDDSHLIGRWYGYVEPQGYPVTLRIHP